MAGRLIAAAIAACLCTAAAAATLPWVLPGDGVPKDTIRVTTLGSGTPDVRRQQVASGFLIELGNGEKLIFDLGSGAYVNLLSTGVSHADLTKVICLTHHSPVFLSPTQLRVPPA
jgi:ribonuclease Z